MLLGCIAWGREVGERARGKSVLIVLGNTGAGKSAFINLLHGCSFALDEEGDMAVSPCSAVPELMRIGHTNSSETFAPQVGGGHGDNSHLTSTSTFVGPQPEPDSTSSTPLQYIHQPISPACYLKYYFQPQPLLDTSSWNLPKLLVSA